MYRLNCKSETIQKNCRRLSCVYPTICQHLETDHKHTTQLYRKARMIPGIKRVASPRACVMTWRCATRNMSRSW
jgi:radical SAM superfamily enzyme YgiQ (UPF0313 family)